MQLRDVDLNLLPALNALLQEQSVTKAAARLGLSVPAVSHALSRLREQLGDPLLVRAGRKMVPSPRALELGPRVQALVAEIAQVFEPHHPFVPAQSDRSFVIHGTDYVVLVLGLALDRLTQEAAPGVHFRFMPNRPDDADLVREGKVDLAIGVFDKLHPEIRIQKLYDEELVCAVRRDHPKIGRRMSLDQYAKLPHIQVAPRGRPGGLIDNELGKKGLQRRVRRHVPFFFAGLSMAAQTDDVLTLPKRLAVTHAESFGLRLLGLPLAVDRYAVSQVWHPRHEGDAGHQWLRGQVVAAASMTKPTRR